MKKIILICLTLCFFAVSLAGCNSRSQLRQTDEGFYDQKNKVYYVPCSYLAVSPVTIEGEYAQYKDDIFYKILFEEPTNFICDNKSGVGGVYRNANIPDITLENFEPIAGAAYVEGLNSIPYADYFHDNPSHVAEISLMQKALLEDDAVSVDPDSITDEHELYIRLFSQKFPGLYYSLVFYSDTAGNFYLKDRGTGKSVHAPTDIIARLAS